MNKLYHITKKRNLSKILTEGLKTKSRIKGMSGRKRWECIFLTDNIEHVVNLAGIIWMKRNDASILEIDCNGLNIIPHTVHSPYNYYEPILINHEYITKDTILPYRIKVMNIMNEKFI